MNLSKDNFLPIEVVKKEKLPLIISCPQEQLRNLHTHILHVFKNMEIAQDERSLLLEW